mmetsp:Transcript_28588/g.62186  ORF Transcript_28588/g.62186 Transcript_28588/m.62186 type:complete len:470 (-) Transcript_28588:152-1561(-)
MSQADGRRRWNRGPHDGAADDEMVSKAKQPDETEKMPEGGGTSEKCAREEKGKGKGEWTSKGNYSNNGGCENQSWSEKGGGKGKWSSKGRDESSSGYGKGGPSDKGQGKWSRNGKGYAGTQNWDEAQLKKLDEGSKMDPSKLADPRPQRPVEAFPPLTVAADWPERRAPRSGSSFYLPLIWSALLLDDDREEGNSPLWRIFNSLGDTKHFHNGRVRRATRADLLAAQPYWQQVFSGWDNWVIRLRGEMDKLGRDNYATQTLRYTSVTACALIYGDLQVLGATPHLSNARQHGTQDAIMELDFALRLEIEASIATLFLPGGEAYCRSFPSASRKVPEGPAKTPSSSPAISPTSKSGASAKLVVPSIEPNVDKQKLTQWCEASAEVFRTDGADLGEEDVARELPAFASFLRSKTSEAPVIVKDTIKGCFGDMWNFAADQPVPGARPTAKSLEAKFRDLATRVSSTSNDTSK